MRNRRLALICLGLAVAVPAFAQDQTESYRPDFFAAAHPATAMDMISRLPGFTFDGGDGSRGFSGNSGNVLINGQRPTSKTDSLSSVLSRIVASDVERIDVIHGSAPGIDMQGKPVMANVIRKETPSTDIVAVASETYFNTGRALPGAQLQYSRTEGARGYDLSIRRDANFNDEMGEANITRIDASGKAVRSEETRRGSGGNIGLHGAVNLPLGGGAFNANSSAQMSDFNNGTFYDDPGAPQNFASTSHNLNGEFGASYELDLGSAVLDLELLQRLGRSVSNQSLDDNGASQRFSSLRATGESITRFTLRYPLTGKLSLEGGAEAAYNFLNGRSLFTQGGVLVAVPSSHVSVNEQRGETFGQLSWQIADGLSLDTGLHAEYSIISEQGDTNRSRSFFYLKPRALMTWSINPNSQLRMRIEHQLGQLNFDDFVSSVSLTQNNVTAGNPDLRPDQSWQSEIAYEHRFWERGAVTVSFVHQNISNILDDKPLVTPDGSFDVRGNIGSGRSDQLNLNLAVPTDAIGLAGGLVSGSASWRDSAVTDPLTGMQRRFSFDDASTYSLDFTQDLTAWKSSWGLHYYNGWKEIGYRVAQADHVFGAPSLGANWTYKPDADLNLTFSVDNILIASRSRFSDYYAGPRNISPITNREIEFGYARPRFFISLRRTFNG